MLSRRAALLSAFAGLSTVAVPWTASAADLPLIRVAGPPDEGYKDVYYAVQAGLFEKHGVDVQPGIVHGGSVVLAGLVSGAYEVGYSNLMPILQGRDHGLGFQIVAPSTLYAPDHAQNAMLVARDSTIRSARDLNGKTIGTQSLQDLNSIAMRAWIDKNGGNSSSIHVLEVPSPAAVAALTDHRIDAMSLSEPLLREALATGKVRILCEPQSAIAAQFLSQAFVAMSSYVGQHADAMTRFARAMHEAAIYNNAHLPQTVTLVASFTSIPADVIAHSIRAIDAEYVLPQNIQPLIDTAARYGAITHTYAAEELISPVALKPAR